MKSDEQDVTTEAVEYITIARLRKTQGRIGEIAAELLTDFPERFAERRHLSLLPPSGARRAVELEDFWPHKGMIVLKFAGVDSINDAELLLGAQVQIEKSERAELDEDTVYVSDLMGCMVWAAEGDKELRAIGEIVDVLQGAGDAPLLELQDGSLIPWVQGFIVRLELEQKKVTLKLPEGLIELQKASSVKQAEPRKERP